MGNRAVVCFDKFKPTRIAIYLHWNGGRDSIEAFLKATRILMGDRLGDESYAQARFIQVIGTAMVGNLSFGIGTCKQYGKDQDNGVYVIDSETMTIKDRIFSDWYEEEGETFHEQMEHNLNEFTNNIIKLVNASYIEDNADPEVTYKQKLLPTAEEYDAQEAEIAASK